MGGVVSKSYAGKTTTFGGYLSQSARQDPEGIESPSPSPAQHGRIIDQRMCRPVFADLAKEPVLDRIPLRSAGGIMADRHAELIGIHQLFLERIFPQTTPGPIAAAAIGQDEQVRRLGIALASFGAAPEDDRFHGKLGGIMGGAG